jgi:hypothetical protein
MATEHVPEPDTDAEPVEPLPSRKFDDDPDAHEPDPDDDPDPDEDVG